MKEAYKVFCQRLQRKTFIKSICSFRKEVLKKVYLKHKNGINRLVLCESVAILFLLMYYGFESLHWS